MTVKELISKLRKSPPDYKVEFHAGTDWIEVTYAELDKSHKRTDWWKRRRKVVILK